MDYLSLIKQPIQTELNDFIELFNDSLSHSNGLLESALSHIRKRGGKRMRPMLMLLMAKNYGGITDATKKAAVGLEPLHTASLVHDDVVDESEERRGQRSVNATYDNKVAVLVGDYINTTSDGLSEDIYYHVIEQKTAALFEACCSIGAISAGKSDDDVEAAVRFGQNVGIIFQIRDDIFDYFDSKEIGKPTGNDMAEGKLTLPAIYAINSTNNEEMKALARKVKARQITTDEIARLVQFTKENGGIEYAEKRMLEFHDEAQQFIKSEVNDPEVAVALQAYLDFVIQRNN